MRVMLLVAVLGGCDQLFGIQELHGPTSQRSRTITITQRSDAPLVDFPVSIVMQDADLAMYARDDGRDIHFVDPNGTELPFELVAYGAGALEAWVRVTLARTTELELVYGDGVPRPADPKSAWSSLYAAVWHLGETPTGGTVDATGGYDMTAGSSVPGSVDGVVGSARSFDELTAPDPQSMCATGAGVIDHAKRSFSYSAWVNHGVLVATFDQPFCAGGLTTGQSGFALEYTATATNADLSDEVAHVELTFGAQVNGWAHLVVVVDRNAAMVHNYTNGMRTAVATLTLTGNIVNAIPICFAGPNGYNGLVDEVRVYTQALSPDWIAAEYDNVMRRTQFVFVGDPQ